MNDLKVYLNSMGEEGPLGESQMFAVKHAIDTESEPQKVGVASA